MKQFITKLNFLHIFIVASTTLFFIFFLSTWVIGLDKTRDSRISRTELVSMEKSHLYELL